MFKIALFIGFCFSFLFGEFEYSVENSNLSVSQKEYVYNYNRLRFRGDYVYENHFVTIIADGVNYFGQRYINSQEFLYLKLLKSDTPIQTQTDFLKYESFQSYLKLYRVYYGYEDNDNRIVIGLQNISMGVGRVWTPTNIFNPKNIYALEPDETFGVMALSYTRHIDENSDINFIVSVDDEKNLRYAGRYKAFLEISDLAVNIVYSDDIIMLGFEIEANLAQTGIELRAEISNIESEIADFTQIVLGADYGFTNGLNLIVESLYSSQKFSSQDILLHHNSPIISNLVYSNFYTAVALSYSFNIFLDTSMQYIESFNTINSRFFTPSLTYTLNDYNSFVISTNIYDAKEGSEFYHLQNSYYLKYSIIF